jgi:hypothetical protein
MSKESLIQQCVAPFRTVEFRDRAEFEEYSKTSETLRGDRWLYEQSLATLENEVKLQGTCGLCLTETVFTACTRNGEPTAGGRVPNWREELVCDCRQRLGNRHRAILHYLLAAELIHPWTRMLGLGEMGALLSPLRSLSQRLNCWNGAIEQLSALNDYPDYHVIISMEQFHAGLVRPDILTALSSQLVDGGRLVFTTPFDVNVGSAASGQINGPIGWETLSRLREHGFSDAKASMYWSEEFGYLGPLNFIFEASK